MHSKRLSRLIRIVSCLLGLSLALSLGLYVLRQNISLYLTPSELVQQQPNNQRHLRLGGVVVSHSVHHDPHSLYVTFMMTDFQKQLRVTYTGILPSLFREGQGIIAEGVVDRHGVFQASTILAKHNANYHPPNVDTKRRQREQA